MKTVSIILFSLAASLASAAELELTWKDNSANELGFEIERRQDGGEWKAVAVVPPNTERWLDTGLTLGETYTYRVHVFNAAGRAGPSNEASGVARDPLPEKPKAATDAKVESPPEPYRPVIIQIGISNTVGR